MKIIRDIVFMGICLFAGIFPSYAQNDFVIPENDTVPTPLNIETHIQYQSQPRSNLQFDYQLPSFEHQASEVPNVVPQSFLNQIAYEQKVYPMLTGDFATSGVIYGNRNNILYGQGSQRTLMGLGRQNDAAIIYERFINSRLSFEASMNATKLQFPSFTGNSFGVAGAMTYRLSDKVSMNVFGNYNTGYFHGMQNYGYGGTLRFNMSDHFSLETGVRRNYDPFKRKWETIPVAIPTFKFDNGTEIGLDIGGILYEIFKGINSHNNSYGPPQSPIPAHNSGPVLHKMYE